MNFIGKEVENSVELKKQEILDNSNLIIDEFVNNYKTELEKKRNGWFKMFGMPYEREYNGLVFSSRKKLHIPEVYHDMIARIYSVKKFRVEQGDANGPCFYHFGETYLDETEQLQEQCKKKKSELHDLYIEIKNVTQTGKSKHIAVYGDKNNCIRY